MKAERHMSAEDCAMFVGLGILWLLVAGAVVGAFVGWVLNIVALAHIMDGFTGMVALRIVGIFIAPLGAVLGYV